MRIPSHAAALFAAALLLGAGAGPTTASPAAQANNNVSLHGVDLERSTIPDLQNAMDRHRISSLELTIFYLARIRQLNPDLHAVITTSPTALAEALLSDIRRAACGPGTRRGRARQGQPVRVGQLPLVS